ncbi:hypothetical protein M409DRAFT_23796 [Zasmidium cellare ATCC 36951]|uniref:N-terminal nucleophile aminohydrolase n=1 Tax=Zasmidium cellare ATCC 36951 TaxID=1080233 RepID=A0A6A6CIQ5_ZASCE|nr:uncharacterized protein M409DRAFT_23796 [Zasmidium cellare ATCC 36951]KAF2166068.1 hypothetical protein M409DRAFT_23796 [Zasmidium cellare ATCC 36951]
MFSSKSSKPRKQSDLACIFVHAGAGFHSKDNESYHLQACNDACKVAMAVMRAGGSAVDVVEVAIKALEDREITNAGYGSNLSFDGVVECDAIIVDPYGRSGAAGAVSQIKNPISLARLLLDHTTQSLSLKRVPPNLLVGQGATKFARDHGMVMCPHETLVSPFAKHRWQKWRADLAKAERHRHREETKRFGTSPAASEKDLTEYYDQSREYENVRKTHEKAMDASMYNDAQPISPPPSDNFQPDSDSTPGQQSSSSWSLADDDPKDTTPNHPDEYIDPEGPPGSDLENMSRNPFANSTQKLAPSSPFTRVSSQGNIDGGQQLVDVSFEDDPDADGLELHAATHSQSVGSDSDDTAIATIPAPPHQPATSPSTASQSFQDLPTDVQQKTPASPIRQQSINVDGAPTKDAEDREVDLITDTVGAIAIDMFGNIACGASSGGIGMKHRGRIGPAALVGVGATVIPVDPQDEDRTTVATVTSGTGEHMSTTMAASVCSDRVFNNVRKVSGVGVKECMEEEAVRGFIQKDFMGHPSVKHSDSTGAIGMLTVKKTKDGAWLYFGHNTNSFALASMHSDEVRPVCTMSRSNSNGSIAQGGRGIRYRKKR